MDRRDFLKGMAGAAALVAVPALARKDVPLTVDVYEDKWLEDADSVAASEFDHAWEGARPDLADIIYNISPVETPFMSLARKRKANEIKHEWVTDTLTKL